MSYLNVLRSEFGILFPCTSLNWAQPYRNIRLIFAEESINERTVRRFQKFGNENFENELRDRAKSTLKDKLKDKVDAESDVSPMTVFRYLAAMGKNWGNG